MITKDKILAIVPEAKTSPLNLDELAQCLNDNFDNVTDEIDLSPLNRQAAFISQCAYESQYFSRVTENLNYSAAALRAVFPKYFLDIIHAQMYERNPMKIANYIYANRMGNGPETSGDGWKYKGRGLIQLTGKSNYAACGLFLKKNLVDFPDYLETIEGAVKSAVWFWKERDINKYADVGDITEVTKLVNGGAIGLAQRQTYYNTALKVLGA